MHLYHWRYPASCVSYHTGTHLTLFSATLPLLLPISIFPYTTLALNSKTLSISPWPWLFTSSLCDPGSSLQASFYLSMTLALHLKPLSSTQASLYLSMTLALHLKPLSTSPCHWLFTSSLSLPLHDPGSSPQASLSLSMTLALHLKPLHRSVFFSKIMLFFPEGALGSRVHRSFTQTIVFPKSHCFLSKIILYFSRRCLRFQGAQIITNH